MHNLKDPELAQFYLDSGVDPNRPSMERYYPLDTAGSDEVTDVLLKGGANPNNPIGAGEGIALHWVNSLSRAQILLNGGADPLIPNGFRARRTAIQENKYVRQALALASRQDKADSVCEWIKDPSEIKVTQCGRKKLCMGKVVCVFVIFTSTFGGSPAFLTNK